MLKRIRAKHKSRKGVLTVEAAIILPIFIMVMVFILSMLKLFYFHLAMQQALQNVGLTLAQYGYVIERTIGMEEFTLKEETSQKEAEIKSGVETLIDDGRIMISVLENLGLDNISEAISSGQKFGDDAKKLVETIQSVDGKTIVNYLLISAMNEVGGDFVKWMIGDYLSSMEAEGSVIQNLEYDLIVEAGTKDILLIVEYDYEFPFFYDGALRFQQMVRMHPWIGGDTPGVYQRLIGGE